LEGNQLYQSCLNAEGEKLSVMVTYPKRGTPPRFEPLVNIPQSVRESVPLIHIGTNRSLKEQLPSARFSLLRKIFEDINVGLQDPSQTVRILDKDRNEVEVQRVERFRQLITQALRLLKTDEFKKLEESIKRNALEQLGLDGNADQIDLYFTLMDPMDFYKSLDIMVKDAGFAISATEVGEGLTRQLMLKGLTGTKRARFVCLRTKRS
jgi:putative ATP-dependent endonuclease of the OLD family